MLSFALAEGAVSIADALADGTTVFNWVITTITGNAILTATFCLGVLVPVGVKVFKKIKSAAR